MQRLNFKNKITKPLKKKQMKRTFILAFLLTVSYFGFSQTIVSTDPENRDAVLEEFTGRNCGFCPEGHAIAENLKSQHGDDFWIINVHAGGFSPSTYPNLNSAHGASLNSYFGVTGYPSGTVNRHDWGQGVIHGRATWTSATNSALANPAYCNVAVEASIDQVTRTVTAYVEVYYTDDSPVASNYLSVAILGNGIIGYQSGGSSNYVHNHFLIEFINENGPWGDEITTTSNGNLYTSTYTWTLPETMPVENGPDLDATTLEVVAFVTETDHADIINGHGGDVAYSDFVSTDVAINQVIVDERYCYDLIAPQVEIINGGNGGNLTACTIEYSVNGGDVESYSWTGDLAFMEKEVVNLPEIQFNDFDEENTLNIEVILNGDGNTNNNSCVKTFYRAPLSAEEIYVKLSAGAIPSEISWEVVNSTGEVVYSTVGQNTTTTLELSSDECYNLNVYETTSTPNGFGNGYMTIRDFYGNLIDSLYGDFGAELTKKFLTGNFESTEEIINNKSLSIYPNPTSGNFGIDIDLAKSSLLSIEIFDNIGRVVYTKQLGEFEEGNHQIKINDANLQSGIYFVKVSNGTDTNFEKIQILK